MKGWKEGENSAGKKLKEWWGVSFYRSPASGALATTRANSLPPSVVSGMTGDVICDLHGPGLNPNISFPFVVEVKAYEKISLYALIRRGAFKILPGDRAKGESDLWLSWYQAKVEAMRGNRWPLLMFKEDRKGWFVAFSMKTGLGEHTVENKLDALFFHDMVIMSWDKFEESLSRSRVETIACREMAEGTLKTPDKWSEPTDCSTLWQHI